MSCHRPTYCLLYPPLHGGQNTSLVGQLMHWELGRQQLGKWTRWSRCSEMKKAASWHPHEDTIRAMALSRDGEKLAFTSWDDFIGVCRSGSGSLIDAYQGHDEVSRCLVLTPDGNSLISAGEDACIRVWDASGGGISHEDPEGDRLCLQRLDTNQGSVFALAMSGDGRVLVSGHHNTGIVMVWNVGRRYGRSSNFQSVSKCMWHAHLAPKHKPWVADYDGLQSVTISRDGTLLVCGGVRGTINLWSLVTYQRLQTIDAHNGEHISHLALTLNDAFVVSASQEYKSVETVRVWEASSAREVACLNWCMSQAAISPDDSVLVTFGSPNDSVMYVWNLDAIIRRGVIQPLYIDCQDDKAHALQLNNSHALQQNNAHALQLNNSHALQLNNGQALQLGDAHAHQLNNASGWVGEDGNASGVASITRPVDFEDQDMECDTDDDWDQDNHATRTAPHVPHVDSTSSRSSNVHTNNMHGCSFRNVKHLSSAIATCCMPMASSSLEPCYRGTNSFKSVVFAHDGSCLYTSSGVAIERWRP